MSPDRRTRLAAALALGGLALAAPAMAAPLAPTPVAAGLRRCPGAVRHGSATIGGWVTAATARAITAAGVRRASRLAATGFGRTTITAAGPSPRPRPLVASGAGRRSDPQAHRPAPRSGRVAPGPAPWSTRSITAGPPPPPRPGCRPPATRPRRDPPPPRRPRGRSRAARSRPPAGELRESDPPVDPVLRTGAAAAEPDHREPDRAGRDRRDGALRPHLPDHRRRRQVPVRLLHQVGRAAERRDHAREASPPPGPRRGRLQPRRGRRRDPARARRPPASRRRAPASPRGSAARGAGRSDSRSRRRPRRALPAALASGASMSVISATVRRPAPFATATMLSASARASRRLAMKAPEPCFTSMTSPSSPAASFFDRIEAVIRSRDSTVAGHVADRVEAPVGRARGRRSGR